MPARWQTSSISLGALAFLMMVAYWPGTDGAATSVRWAIFAISIWPFMQPTTFTRGHAALIAFIGWSALTFLWTSFPWDWVQAMAELLMVGTAFWVGSATKDLRPLYVGAGLGIAVSSVFAVAQLLGHNPAWIAISANPGGLFVNKNMLAEAAALALVAAISERIWWLVPLVLPSVVLPAARGPLLAVAVALAMALPRWLAAAAAVAAAAVVLIQPAGARHPTATIMIRIDYWIATIGSLNIFGHGAGSYLGDFARHASERILNLERPIHAHNDFLEAAFETGIIGAALFGLLVLLVARSENSTARLVLATFLVEGIFGFPLHMAPTAFVAALVAGRLCDERYAVRRPNPFRRVRIQAGPLAAEH